MELSSMTDNKSNLTKSRYGIAYFFLSFALTTAFTATKVSGSTLILNIIIFGVPTAILLVSLVFLSKKTELSLKLALLAGGINTLWTISYLAARVLDAGSVFNAFRLILDGGIRVLALWAIWSTLRQVKRQSIPNSPHGET